MKIDDVIKELKACRKKTGNVDVYLDLNGNDKVKEVECCYEYSKIIEKVTKSFVVVR